MQKWEYKVLNVEKRFTQIRLMKKRKDLNEMGKMAGNWSDMTLRSMPAFKRPVQEAT